MSTHLLEKYLERAGVCSNPVFVVGSPRSGTSVLAWALAQHADFWTAGETHILYSLFGSTEFLARVETERAFTDGLFEKQGVSRDEFLGFLGLGINALISSRCTGKRWVEQTPVNTLMIDVLTQMFPGASFVHILRDPAHVINSMINFVNAVDEKTRRHLSSIRMYPPWATDFRAACRTWTQSVEKAMDFCERRPDRCLTVRYEQLVAHPAHFFKNVLAFLGVPFDQKCPTFVQSTKLHSSFSADKSRCNPWDNWDADQKAVFLEESLSTGLRFGLINQDSFAPSSYCAEVGRFRSTLQAIVPPRAKVIVVSKGDNELLRLENRVAMHFPQDEQGRYAGYHPGTSDEAIQQLNRLAARGAEFLAFPPSASWWLDHYAGFRDYLNQACRPLATDGACVVYDLRQCPSRNCDHLNARKSSSNGLSPLTASTNRT